MRSMTCPRAEQHSWVRGAAAALAVAAALTLGACSGSGSDGGGAVAATDGSAGGGVAVQVTKDEARWTLPTDPYMSSSATVDQAWSQVQASCMHERGHSSFKVRFDASAPAPQTLAADGFSQVFNEQVAAKYGYRQAPDARDLLADEVAASGGSLYANESADFQSDLGECATEADTELNGGVEPTYSAADAASGSITDQLNQLHVDTASSELSSAAKAWRTCMAPLGISDLPQTPWDPNGRPPDSLVDEWGWQSTGQASADEIRVATADAACRRSSGWFDRYYDAGWSQREAFVSQHLGDLEPIRLDMEAKRARAEKILAKGDS